MYDYIKAITMCFVEQKGNKRNGPPPNARTLCPVFPESTSASTRTRLGHLASRAKVREFPPSKRAVPASKCAETGSGAAASPALRGERLPFMEWLDGDVIKSERVGQTLQASSLPVWPQQGTPARVLTPDERLGMVEPATSFATATRCSSFADE